MSPVLADRLRTARRQAIVGREAEIQRFCRALRPSETDFTLLYLFGPGGVGKTTLLREFKALAEQAQAQIVWLDSREVEPAPMAFRLAVTQAMGLPSPEAIFETLASGAQRVVLLIDTFEQLAPLEGWLREAFFPQLAAPGLVVLAGRLPPAVEWQLDPGWHSLLEPMALGNLSAAESRRYLTRRGVPETEHQRVLDFTHGHPLALSLVADGLDQRPGLPFQPTEVPEVLKVLLAQFVQNVPGPAHRVALEACALVRVLTEGLLAAMLSVPDAHELFDWLRNLSFIEASSQGLFPHELARDTLSADLRWRNPDWYAELHRRARTYYSGRLPQVRPPAQQQVLYDYVFLHRDNAVVRPFFEWQGTGSGLIDRLETADAAAIDQMVARHEGVAALPAVRHWLERQPGSFVVCRGSDHQVLGFVLLLALDQVTAQDEQGDPPVGVVRRFLAQHAPLRRGETATFFRFWLARETDQAVSAIQSQLFITMVRHYLTTPGLVYTFLPCRDPDFWAPMFAYADLTRLPELDFTTGDQRYGVYGHNWRTVPPLTWLSLLGERELGLAPMTPPDPLIVLDEAQFALAVREALKQVARPLTLLHSPLLHTRLVTDQVDWQAADGERVRALQTSLHDAAATLQASPKTLGFYRVLHHTYFQPAPTQEAVAELLDLPFSTYRRHLKTAIDRLVERLWHWETQGRRPK